MEFFTVPQAAKALKLGTNSVRQLIHSGRLEAADWNLAPNAQRPRWRISREAIERFHREHLAQPPKKPAAKRRRAGGAPPKQFV